MDALSEKEKNRVKGISRFLEILFKIGRIFLYIGIVCLIISAFLIPVVINNTKVSLDKVEFKYNNSSFEIRREGSKTVFYADGEKMSSEPGAEFINTINKYYNKYSNRQLIGYSEAYILIIIAYMYISSLLLKALERLFKNIRSNKTPFTSENLLLLYSSIKYKIIAALIPLIGTIIYSGILDLDDPFRFSTISIVEILVLIVAYYIFKYACHIQNESSTSLYDE